MKKVPPGHTDPTKAERPLQGGQTPPKADRHPHRADKTHPQGRQTPPRADRPPQGRQTPLRADRPPQGKALLFALTLVRCRYTVQHTSIWIVFEGVAAHTSM